MISIRILAKITVLFSALLLASCGTQKPATPAEANNAGKLKNPYPEGTYQHFTAEPTYPKTYNVWKDDKVLSKTDSSNSHIVINLAKQRGYLMRGDEVAVDYPICSGTAERPTPKGTFPIQEKIVDKSSNRYGKIYDAAGEIVNGNADVQIDPIPEGGKFEGAPMRYWMRLTGDGVGHHIGPIRRYPASHACIRGPSATMPLIYSKVRVGTKVTVE